MKKISFATVINILFLTLIFCLPSTGQNLILNPGCEDSLVNGEIPYWTEVVGNNWTHRASGNPPSFEGEYMFFAGVAEIAELQQDVDVSSFAVTIDDSAQYFYFEGYVRSFYQYPPDRSQIILEYLDISKTVKLDSINLGEYNNVNEWVKVTDSTLAPFGTRFIRIRLISTRYTGSNNDGYYDALSLIAGMPVDVSNNFQNLPNQFSLLQNYPNPFNSSTVIRYQLPTSVNVSLKVFDILGKEITTLVDETQHAGNKSVEFNAEHLSSGLYFYRLQAGAFVDTKKLLLLR